ncbi:MAG: alpha/beta fold hydrolase [Acidobacteriota bacterium]
MKLHPVSIQSGSAQLSGVRFGAGPPLLCVHALAFSSRYFSLAAPVLGEHFECVAIDQRGHGLTRHSDGAAGLSLTAMSHDLIAVLDHHRWESAFVGGISLGAATTLRLALDHPTRVRVLLQDLPAFGPESPRGLGHSSPAAEALERGDMAQAAQRAGVGLSAPRARALEEVLMAAWRGYSPAELGPKLASMFRASSRWRVIDNWPEELTRLSMPVELLAIAGDSSHPLAVAEQMARAIPRATLHRRVPSLEPRLVARQWVEVLTPHRTMSDAATAPPRIV